MPYPSLRPYLGAALLLSTACAPAPKGPAPAPIQAAKEPRKITLLCGDKARAAIFDQVGVPSGEQPIDVAVTDRYIWVLFSPARLLRLARQGDKVEVEMKVGHGDEHWSGFDVDPLDGSLWVISDKKTELLHVQPNWRQDVVPLKKVQGEGGFHKVLVATDGLYLLPFGAEKFVWRVDRTGKVLDTAFPNDSAAPKPPGTADVKEARPSPALSGGVTLMRDREGHILAWDWKTDKALESDGKGGWTERPDVRWLEAARSGGPDVRGIGIGTKEERWFLASGPRDLFYWKGRPVFLGPSAQGERGKGAQVFYVPREGGGDNGFAEYLEVCQGLFIDRVATNGTSYAAITYKAVLFGEFADAPDLP